MEMLVVTQSNCLRRGKIADFCNDAAESSGLFSFNCRMCKSIPGTGDLGGGGREVVVEYFNFIYYGISLGTPVWYYENLASNPIPGPCVGGCTKPLWTFRSAFLLFVLRGGESDWIFFSSTRIVTLEGVLLKDKKKLRFVKSTSRNYVLLNDQQKFRFVKGQAEIAFC
jgi:hypothetical protein